MSPRRHKPPIPPQRLAAVTFDSEPEARRRLLNSAFCEKCGKLALRTREDAHNYIGLLLSKRWRQPKPNEHTLAPYACPWKKGWHVGRDSQTAELLKGSK
jgi:hypothetical protein